MAVLPRVGQGKLLMQTGRKAKQDHPLYSVSDLFTPNRPFSTISSILSYRMYFAYLNPYCKIHAKPNCQFKITSNNNKKIIKIAFLYTGIQDSLSCLTQNNIS